MMMSDERDGTRDAGRGTRAGRGTGRGVWGEAPAHEKRKAKLAAAAASPMMYDV